MRAGRAWWIRLLVAALVAAVLTGCGFKMRGASTLPFDTIAVPGITPLAVDLQRNIAAGSNAKLVTQTTDAEAVLAILTELQDKVILSLNTQGQVREYQLRYRVSFRVYNPKGGPDFLAPSQVILSRDITFNNQVLAKENEEVLLYREMRGDAVQQILRRLGTAKRQPDED